MKLRRFSALVLVCLVLVPWSRALADGLVRDGVGPISTGRGGANQGFADNSAIILDNPGAIVNVAGNGLGEIGADTVITDVHYTDSFNSVQAAVRPLPMPVLGYIKKSEDGCWAWGIGAFAPAGFGAAYGQLNTPYLAPFAPTTEFRSIGAMGKILPTLAARVTDRLSVGLNVGIGFCDAEFEGPYVFQNAPLTGVPAIINIKGFGVAPTGSIGMQYQLASDTVIGATYTEQTNFILHGGGHATLLPGFPVVTDLDTNLRIKWPRTVAFGLKHELCPHRRIGADVIWYDWAHAFTQIDIEGFNPTNPLVPVILAGAGTSLPIRDALPLRWTNSVSMRLGYEWDSSDVNTWRLGYVYHGSPVPDATLNPLIDGVLTHGFSIGLSHKMQRAAVNLAYQYNMGKHRYVDQSGIIGGLFNNSSLDADAHFAMISLTFPL